MRRWRVCAAALALAATAVLAACGSSKTSSPSATTAASPVASPSPDATELANRAAGSPAAKLATAVLDPADYPAGFTILRRQPKLVAASDVPGLPAAASAFFAISATPDGNEFVNLIAVAAASEADAAASLASFLPDVYLSGLTGGAANAESGEASTAGAPAGTRAFSYSGTVTANEGGNLTQHEVSGVALGFVHGRTFVVVVGGAYGATARTADLVKIASAIDARLTTAGS